MKKEWKLIARFIGILSLFLLVFCAGGRSVSAAEAEASDPAAVEAAEAAGAAIEEALIPETPETAPEEETLSADPKAAETSAEEAVPEEEIIQETAADNTSEAVVLEDIKDADAAETDEEMIPEKDLAEFVSGAAEQAVTSNAPAAAPAKTGEKVYRYVVKDTLNNIYMDKSNEMIRGYVHPEGQLQTVSLANIMKGEYSPNAVAAFLDHGYFRSNYAQIRDAGLLPEGYVLPDKPYNITRAKELLHIREQGDAVNRYVVITDSYYLQTEQLKEIAAYHGFDELDSYLKELDSFETTYIPKAEWGK